MALIPYHVNVGALKDSDTAGNTNYYIGEVVNITDLSDVNVSLFSDRAGTVPLPQNGISNVTDAKGVFSFFVAAGSYKVKALGEEEEFDLKAVDDVILSLTLAEAIAKTDAVDGMTSVSISDRDNSIFKYKSGLIPNSFNIINATGSSLQLELQVDSKTTARSFGAKGDWNATLATGNDDTNAIQAFIDYLSATGTQVTAGVRKLKFDAGSFFATELTIPESAEFGFDFVGSGMYTTTLYFDETNSNPAINSEIEAVTFDAMSLIGASDNSTIAANYKGLCYRGKKPSDTLDVDVMFSSTVRITKWQIGVQAYGRGVTFNGGILSSINDAGIEIVADINAVFGTSRNQLLETSMRNYSILGLRTDGVENILRVAGSGPHKDYINDIKITQCSFVSSSRLIIADNATLRNIVLSDNTSESCFSGGVVKANSIIGLTDSNNDWKNLFGGQSIVDNNDTILNIYDISNGAVDITIESTSATALQDSVINCGSGSKNINILNNRFPKAFATNTGSASRYIALSASDIPDLTIKNNKFPDSPHASATATRIYDINSQTSIGDIDGNTANFVWDDWRIRFTPILRYNGTNQTLTSSYGRISKTDQYIDLVLQVAASSIGSGSVTIDLPSNAPVAISEFTSITSEYSGAGQLARQTGWSKVGWSVSTPNVNPSSQRIDLKMEKDLSVSDLSGSDAAGSITIILNVTYRYK